jgi:aspartate dehydrogenase
LPACRQAGILIFEFKKMAKLLKIGIVGCGAIGSRLAKEIESRFSRKAEVCALCDKDKKKAERLSNSLKRRPPVLSLSGLIAKSQFVIEAASVSVSAQVARMAVNAGRDVMIMSTGGLLDCPEVFKLARLKNRKVFLPSGAICGIDGLKAAGLLKIKKARLSTYKHPDALRDAPFIRNKRIDLDKIRRQTVLFEGKIKEAIKGFPQNINVAATIALAGLGKKKALVRIVVSPRLKSNIHQLELEGDFGKITTRAENLPSPDNPRTSFLAVLSAIATLKQILSPVKIGT